MGHVVPCVSIAKGKSVFQGFFREFCSVPAYSLPWILPEDSGFHLIVCSLPPQLPYVFPVWYFHF